MRARNRDSISLLMQLVSDGRPRGAAGWALGLFLGGHIPAPYLCWAQGLSRLLQPPDSSWLWVLSPCPALVGPRWGGWIQL